MAWQTPKLDWKGSDTGYPQEQASQPGAGDFMRIEGNTEYLKDDLDALRIETYTRVAKSSNILLAADSEARTNYRGSGFRELKAFTVRWPGQYQLILQIRSAYSGAEYRVLATNGGNTVYNFVDEVPLSSTYVAKVFDLNLVTQGAQITVGMRKKSADHGAPYLRLVRILGTIVISTTYQNAVTLDESGIS